MKSDNYLDNLPASINPSKGKGIELVYALVSDVPDSKYQPFCTLPKALGLA